jgi:hypothetical protein
MTATVITMARRDRRRGRPLADARWARREADHLRALVQELQQQVRDERQARIRLEALAQRHGAPGWEIDAARNGGAS